MEIFTAFNSSLSVDNPHEKGLVCPGSILTTIGPATCRRASLSCNVIGVVITIVVMKREQIIIILVVVIVESTAVNAIVYMKLRY